jgi:hypothetical protein
MKKINSYNWTPRNQLNIPIPITDPPVDVEKLLGKLYFTLDYTLIISTGEFYYILGSVLSNKFYMRMNKDDIIHKDSYFNEDHFNEDDYD